MVERWGMSSKVGFLAVSPREGQSPLLPGSDPVSEATKELIDAEVRRIVDEELDQVRQLLGDHRDNLEALVDALLDNETLDEADAYAAAGIAREREPAAT
jgi:cell division protease FtsH